MVSMSLEELQDCNSVARGCVSRSVFVFFSYAFTAETKMARKMEEDEEDLEEDEEDVGVLCDIMAR